MNFFIFTILILISQSMLAQQMITAEHAEQLKSIVKTHIDKKGNKKTRFELEFLVKTEAGRTALSNYSAAFYGDRKNFKLVEAYSEFKGKRFLTDPKNITIAEMPILDTGLTDFKTAAIPISNIQQNGSVRVVYELFEEATIPGVAMAEITLTNSVLAKQETFAVESEIPVRAISLNLDKYYEIKEWQESGLWKVEMKPTGLAYAMVGKELRSGYASVSSVSDWLQLNRTMSSGYNKVLSSARPQELARIVNQAKKLTTSKEKIEFVSGEITKLVSYSGTWMSKDQKFYPKSFASLFSVKKGDCKDFSTLLTAALKDLSFEAYPAITFRSAGYAGEDKLKKLSTLPSLSIFNHAIVWAKDSAGKVWWVDPTNPLVIADVISQDILGNFALVLNGTSNQVEFLPQVNQQKSKITFDRVVKINLDNSVSVSGKVLLNEVAYNEFGQIERQYGIDYLKKMVASFVNPNSKAEVTLKKNTRTKIPSYEFSFISSSLLSQTKENKSLQVINPIIFPVSRISRQGDSYLGSIGELQIKTKIENEQAVESFMDDCLVRSPWLDAERIVENLDSSIQIIDTVKTKKRLISSIELGKEETEYYFSDFSNCYENNSIKLREKSQFSKPAEIEDPRFGPDVYKMSFEDVAKLNDLAGPDIRKVDLKILKFTWLKLAKNPNDAAALTKRAMAVRGLGYIKGEMFLQSYVEEAKVLNSQALSLLSGKFDREVYSNKVIIGMSLNLEKEVLASLEKYNQFVPKDFQSYLFNASVAKYLKNFDYANGWLAAAEKIARNSVEKNKVISERIRILAAQGKNADVVALYKKMIENDPKNPWLYHNVAVYLADSNIDEAIAYERKALAISDFGMARFQIAQLLLTKAFAAQEKYDEATQNGMFDMRRMPAGVKVVYNGKDVQGSESSGVNLDDLERQQDEFILEALKFQPRDKDCLRFIVGRKYKIFKQTSSQKAFQQLKHYADILIESHGSDPDIVELAKELAKLK